MITFHIITIFPDMFDSYLNESMMKRAQEEKVIDIQFYNPRDFATDVHKTVDDRPYGGGPGMVMKAEPLLQTIAQVQKEKGDAKVILFSPSGIQFTNTYADSVIEEHTDIILIAGRYEGIDARVKEITGAQEVSIGPYTLTGGELPAMVCIDAITRRLPGVLGNKESVEENRVAAHEMYTRPEVVHYKGKEYRVPEVLISGNHKEIEAWRAERDEKA